MSAVPVLRLANGVLMPQIGLGTARVSSADAEGVIADAIGRGYRLIDTAEYYRNEGGVGRGLTASGVPRESLFVTTKLTAQWHGHDEVQEAFAASASRLRVDYIDLYLIHWPMPAQDRYVDAWRGMVRLLEEGKVRAIGVSNFKPAHIDRLLAATGIAPHVNQIQLNPRVPRHVERDYHRAHAVVTESWSPIGTVRALMEDTAIGAIAAARGRTPAQVLLRWHVQQGLVPIPKTVTAARLSENLAVFDFALSAAEMDAIAGLDGGGAGAVDADAPGMGV